LGTPFTNSYTRCAILSGFWIASRIRILFRKGFESGRRYYFVDAKGEEPQRATKLSAKELLHQIAVPDAKTGHYRFDEEASIHLEEYLGVFLGYMSGPLSMARNGE
jgi:hypothetical protein